MRGRHIAFRTLGASAALVLLLWTASAAGSLAQELVSSDDRARETAVEQAAKLSPDDQRALTKHLIPSLKGSDTEQREHAAEALKKLGASAEAAIPALQSNLNDDFPYVRVRSAEALAAIGPAAIPAFITALKNDNREVRAVALNALTRLGPEAAPALPAIIKILVDPEPDLRSGAAKALQNCGAAAAGPLMQALGDPAFKNHLAVIQTLGAIKHTPDELPAQLVPFLGHSKPELRMAAVQTLTRKNTASIAAVQSALASDNALTRAGAATVLGDIGPAAASTVPDLITLLRDPEASVRAEAVSALGKMHSAGATAVPALKEALKDQDREVAARAQIALTNIAITTGGPKEIKNLLRSTPDQAPPTPAPKPSPTAAPVVPAKKSKPPVLKAHAPTAAPAAPTPTPIAATYLAFNSTASLKALSMSAQKAEPAARAESLATLAALLKDIDVKTSSAAAQALAQVGTPEANQILESYKKVEALKKINTLVAELRTSTGPLQGCQDELVAIGPSVVPAVAQALKDARPRVRLAAAQILERLGAGATAAVPALIEALNDSDAALRQQAAQALEKCNNPQAKNPLRFYYVKEKIRALLKMLHLQ